MPKSKRKSDVALAKTEKKAKKRKISLVEDIRQCVDQYKNLFVFSFENMRTSLFKDVRNQWRTSRFFLGKNKVMAFALGRAADDEYKDQLHLASEKLVGMSGLLFTDASVDDVISFLKNYKELDFAKSGFIATSSVSYPEGPLLDVSAPLEPLLRKLGMPTQLKNGVIHLLAEHTVCKEGQALTPEQAKLLKLFGIAMSEFRISPLCHWSDGQFQSFL